VTSEDLAERTGELTERIVGRGRCSPSDEAVGAQEDRAVALDAALAHPSAARIVEISVEVADPNRIERKSRLGGQLVGRLAPRTTVLPCDEQEATGKDEVLDRAALAVLVLNPGVGQRSSRPCRGLVHADVVDRRGRLGAVRHDGSGVVAVAVLNVELRELHRLRAHQPQDA